MTKKRKQPQQQRPFKGQKHGFQSSSKTATTAASCQEGDRKHVTMQDEPQRLKTPHAWSMKKDVPFKPEDRILLVGEGDFSFAHCLLTRHQCTEITATCLDTEADLVSKYPQAKGYITALKDAGQRVIYGVDVRKMTMITLFGGGSGWEGDQILDRRQRRRKRRGKERDVRRTMTEEELRTGNEDFDNDDDDEMEKRSRDMRAGAGDDEDDEGWDKVVFNFPHVGGKSTDVNRQVRYNQELLIAFFRASKPLLKKPSPPPPRFPSPSHSTNRTSGGGGGGGVILVTLFQSHPYTLWNIHDLARHSGLAIRHSVPFRSLDYPGYQHARTLGNILASKRRRRRLATVDEEGDGRGHVDVDVDVDADGNAPDEPEPEPEPEPETTRRGWKGEERDARMYIFDNPDPTLFSSSTSSSTSNKRAATTHTLTKNGSTGNTIGLKRKRGNTHHNSIVVDDDDHRR